jgi:L-threonylcarbamoyladenylate synthase
LPLVAGSREQARLVAAFTSAAEAIAARFWPGPLTIVAAARPGLAAGVAAKDGSVAVRVPDQLVARRLAEAVGFAIVSTSANRSGSPPSADAGAAARDLAADADLVIDCGATPGGPPSTIVDARVEPPVLVRAGAVPFPQVLEVLARP